MSHRPTDRRMPKRRFVERAVLGTFMGLAALFIEWRVRRTLRRAEAEREGAP